VKKPHQSTLAKKTNTVTRCVVFSAAWSGFAILLLLMFPSFFEYFNLKMYDWKMSLWRTCSYSPDIVHLDIDDQAIKEFGQWPWDRALSGQIVSKLTELGARLVVFDIFYASAGKSQEGNVTFVKAIERAGNVISAAGIGELSDSHERRIQVGQDRARADALYDVSWPLQVPAKIRLRKAVDLTASVLPLLPIIQTSKGVGHIAATPDNDGVYRKIALFVKLEDRCIPSLSLSALLAYWNLKSDRISFGDEQEIKIGHGSDLVTIPADDHGMMLVNWGKPWTSFKHYSAIDVLRENADASRPARYKDKLVIVAVTATGNGDVCATPLSSNAPLNRIHSHAINTCLTKGFIRQVSAFPWIVISLATLAIVFSLASARLSLKWEAISLVLVCLICFIIEIVGFLLWRYDVPLSLILPVFVPAALGSLVIKGSATEWQADQTKRALERYLPPELLESAFSSGMGLDLASRREELTIVFVDMQGFSTLSDVIETEYISRLLKDFFEGMSRTILTNKGRIHQFLGDGFLAVFGDLIPLHDHADAAVKAALEMQLEMAALSAKWANSGIKEFERGLQIRIGINTGIVFIGDLGTDRRLEYAVVGSAVNIASRLQALAPPGGTMMTSRTKALLKDSSRCEGPQNVRLKGIDRETEVYTIHPYSTEGSSREQ
jgi:adenylate cyclase